MTGPKLVMLPVPSPVAVATFTEWQEHTGRAGAHCVEVLGWFAQHAERAAHVFGDFEPQPESTRG